MRTHHRTLNLRRILTLTACVALAAATYSCSDSITPPSGRGAQSALSMALTEAITVNFTGTVKEQSLTLPPDLQSVISAGDPVTGSFTIDPGALDTDPDTTLGLYRYTEAGFGMRANVGGAQIESDPTSPFLTVQVLDDHVLGIAPNGMDRFGVMSFANTVLSPSTVAPNQFHFFLSDLTKTAFDSDAMPAFPLDLGLFGSTNFAQGQITASDGQTLQVFINFTIETMSIQDQQSLSITLDLDPDTINLKSHGNWVTAYIEPMGFDVEDIDPASLTLAGAVPADPKWAAVGDHDGDEIMDLMVKFSRQSLYPHLVHGMQELEVTGSLWTGEDFQGADEVSVIEPPEYRKSR